MLKSVNDLAKDYKKDVKNTKKTKMKVVKYTKSVGIVYETTDYSQFKFYKKNRIVNRSKVEAIKASYLKVGLLCPIIVSPDFYVGEGQHRLVACEELGVPIQYMVSTKVTEETIATVNNVRKSWAPKDYLHSNLDKKVYKTFNKMLDESGLSINTLYTILKGEELNGIEKEAFNTGKLVITSAENQRYAYIVGSILEILNVKKEYKNKLKKSRVVKVACAMILNPKYDHTHFLSQLGQVKAEVVQSINSSTGAKNMLESIYNTKNKQINIVW